LVAAALKKSGEEKVSGTFLPERLREPAIRGLLRAALARFPNKGAVP